MPSFDIIKKHSPNKTFRVSAIMGKFDLQDENIIEKFTGNIDLDNNWQVGLIVGKSGTGKTTIAKQLFPDAYIHGYNYNAESIVDDMPNDVSIEDISKTFNSVGFSSPPSWLKPYHVLSNGEKMRVDLARAILSNEDMFVFDEFTSVVDRQIAQVGSYAIQKAIRRTKKKFIAVTCHFDVIDWLLPDWIFDTDTMAFQSFEGQKKNRPKLNFKIYETKAKSQFWKLFSRYHYLNHSHNKAANVFICTINDEICGFCSVLNFMHPKAKNIRQGHRVVVFPDYQGIGVGIKMIKEVGNILYKQGLRFTFTTSNPSIITALSKEANFVMKNKGRGSMHSSNTVSLKFRKSMAGKRLTTSWEYINK